MATVAGTIIGSALPVPGGAFIGGLIGGFIDQRFLFPALFGSISSTENVVEGPRLNSAVVTLANEGSPLPYLLGTECSTNGVLIWAGPREEVVIETTDEVSIGGGKGGGGGDAAVETVTRTYEYYQSFVVAVSDQRLGRASRVLRVWADEKLIYNNGVWESGVADAIVAYDGSQVLPPASMASDPTVIANSGGAGNIPSFNGTCLVEFRRFFLTGTGNRIPQIRVMVEADPELTRPEAYRKLCLRAGLSESQFDVSGVSGCLRGFVISGVRSSTASLETLQVYTDTLATVEGGKVRFFDRGSETIILIPPDDLGAVEGPGAAAAARGVMTSDVEEQLSRSVEIEFVDPANEWTVGVERELSRAVDLENTRQINLPITMDKGEARAVALRALHRPRLEGRSLEFSLPPRYSYISAGDVLTTTDLSGNPAALRADRVRVGANGRVEVSGVQFDLLAGELEYPPDGDAPPDPGFYVAPSLRQYLLQLPALSVEASATPTIYAAGVRENPDQLFRGATLLRSADDVDFVAARSLVAAATDGFAHANVTYRGSSGQGFGTTTGVFARFPVPVRLFDPEQSLASSTRQQVASLQNNLGVYVGQGVVSVFGFASAAKDSTITDANVWVLNNIVWGLFGSAPPPAQIVQGDRFVFLPGVSRSALASATHPQSAIGRERFYKLVSAGNDIEEVDSTGVVFEGASMRPKVYRVAWSRVGPDGDPSDDFGSAGRGYFDLRWEVKWPYPTGSSIFDPVPGLGRLRFRLEFSVGGDVVDVVEVVGGLSHRVAMFRGPWRSAFGSGYSVSSNWSDIDVVVTPSLDGVEGESVAYTLEDSGRVRDRNGGVLG